MPKTTASGRRVEAGTRPAERLTALYEAHAADAFRYALHLTGRREDAEDVVQHVFLQAYATLEAGRTFASPRAWLIKATKHRALNLIRDRRAAPVAEIDQPGPDAAADAEAEALAEVRAVLWSLPRPQHEAFVLRHWSGLSQDEIADVLATTPHAVESLLVRARAALVAERDAGDPECAGVRRRLARMLEPTSAQAGHVARCRRCRTARTRLLRASEHAAAFALVPGTQVMHVLTAAVPGFGTSGAVAGAAVTGSAAGAASGGAVVSAAPAATKAGVVAKVALAATAAAVAVTAAHPLRSAITDTILHPAPAPATAAAAPRARPAAHAVPGSAVTARVQPATSRSEPAGRARRASAGHGRRGKSAAAHRTSASTHGNRASAPGHTKPPGSRAAVGRGAARSDRANGRSHAHGAGSQGHHTGKR